MKRSEKEKSKPGNIFDAFVKDMFGRAVIFADFLKHYANQHFLSQINLSRIEPAPTHLFGKEGDERIVDLVFQCPLKHGDGALLAVVIFEHQTNSLRDIPQKLLKYISAIWDAEKKAKKPLSAPYFIVLRTGKKPHRKPYHKMADVLPKDENGEPIGTVPEIKYEVVDLPAWDFDKLVGLPQLRLVVGMLKKMSEGALDEFADALMPLQEFESLEDQLEWFKELMPFVAKAFVSNNRKLEVERMNKALKTISRGRADAIVLTIFEEFEEKGRAEGEARGVALGEARGVALGEARGVALGVARGIALGEARALQRVLTARFQKVPKRLSDRITRIQDDVELDSLTVTAATCQSLKEFEKAMK